MELTDSACGATPDRAGGEAVALRVTRTFVAIDAAFSQMRRQLHLGPNERLAIEYLWNYGPMPMSELADHLAVTRAAITTLVDRLTIMGLVGRRTDVDDRRRTIVALSDVGRARVCEVVTPWLDQINRALADYDPAVQDELVRVFDAIGHASEHYAGQLQRKH